MVNIKNVFDASEATDGQRIWVEPFGLTKDLREWCDVQYVLPHIAPPMKLWQWFQEHPDGYEYFRGEYHEFLSHSPYKAALEQLVRAAVADNVTFLHQGDDPAHNSATALYEFLSELEAYLEPGP